MHEKSQAINIFEMFITEVERQLDKNIKIVRSDRGDEYYGRYDESGQNPGPFAKFLEKHGIRAQYTKPGTPQQNGVAERRNRTLMEMVRSMMSYSSVPISLWGEALKTAMYILNRVLWIPHFWSLCVSHLKRRDSHFLLLENHFLENGLESPLIFVFILKGKTK